jgi:predicted dehydrogenase
MADQLRFSVIGCGRMGMRRLRCLKDHPATKIVAVSDSTDELARKAAAEFGVPAHRDWSEVLGPDVDGVFVCTPNKHHAEITIEALRRGKHVFCEKPLARNVAESRAMVSAALASKGFLKTGSNLRYFPNILAAQRLLSEGKIGDLLFSRSWIGHEGWNLTKQWFSQVESSGGGTFLDNGCHVFDILRWFMGEMIECVGMTDTGLWKIEPLEDNAVGVFRSHRGKLALVHSSWTEWAGYFYMEVYGSDGFLRIDCRKAACTLTVGTTKGEMTVQDFSSLPPSSYQDEVRAFVTSLQEGRQPYPSGFDGLRAVQMAHGVYDAGRTGSKSSLWTEDDRALSERVQAAERRARP